MVRSLGNFETEAEETPLRTQLAQQRLWEIRDVVSDLAEIRSAGERRYQ
jgi:hypothetical protein